MLIMKQRLANYIESKCWYLSLNENLKNEEIAFFCVFLKERK